MSVKQMTKKFLVGSLINLVLLFGTWVTIAGAQVTGAIFTTYSDGSFVNANVYNSEFDPFLNGGPRPNAPCSAAGLPNGDYYFQITDPSGSVLLSGYGISNGVVHVSNGVISSYTGTHSTSLGQCGDVTVQLYPFSPTRNPGGEYKVWMTRVENYDELDLRSSFGFLSRYSKTDNFKVLATDDCGEGCGSE
jgi:hypothetical protein